MAALAGLYWFGGAKYTEVIEQDVAERARALIIEEAPDADIAISGRDVTLIGEAPAPMMAALEDRVAGAWGVRSTENRLVAATLPNGIDFNASYDGRTLNMDGQVDSEEAVDLLADIHTALPPGLNVINSVQSGADEFVNTPGKLETGIASLTQLNRGDLSVSNEAFVLEGVAANQTRIDQIKRLLETRQAVLDPLKPELRISIDPYAQLSEECRIRYRVAMQGNVVNYVTAKHDIREPFQPRLKYIAETAAHCGGTVLVEGHADHRGKENYNQQLSERRSHTVKQFLVDSGMDADRIESFSYGEFRPVASNETKEGMARNRRVEIHIQHVTGK
ncbi:MAG: OmpA family protein [Pseudomonadota bacterium]